MTPEQTEVTIQTIQRFFCKKGLNVQMLSATLLMQLIRSGLVKDIPDIYRLTHLPVYFLDGMTWDRAAALIKAIDRSRDLPLRRLIYGLGMPHVNQLRANHLANAYVTPEAFAQTTLTLLKTHEEALPPEALQWFVANRERVRKIIGLMSRDDLAFIKAKPRTSFHGKRLLFSGTFVQKDLEIHRILRLLGARRVTALTKYTDIVFLGEGHEREIMQRAKGLGIPVYSQLHLNDLCTVTSGKRKAA
jgi:DNA ligase (NAD+)